MPHPAFAPSPVSRPSARMSRYPFPGTETPAGKVHADALPLALLTVSWYPCACHVGHRA